MREETYAIERSEQEYREVLNTHFSRSAEYYAKRFKRLDASEKTVLTFNFAAALLGPFWWAHWRILHWYWVFLITEVIAFVCIYRGLFTDLGETQRARAERLSKIAETRLKEAREAAESGAENAQSLMESAKALAAASEGGFQAAQTLSSSGVQLAVWFALVLAILKIAQGLLATPSLNADFLNRLQCSATQPKGKLYPLIFLHVFSAATYGLCAFRFSGASIPDWVKEFPADIEVRRAGENVIISAFEWMSSNWSGFFLNLTKTIKLILEGMEALLVQSPWPVVMLGTVLIARQVSGNRVAIFAAAAMSYVALFGFWEKAMSTIALLGSAAIICIFIGIPLGIVCARNQKLFAIVRPILDLMQTMPAFVYLIPVIAFFGVGKPPGILATTVFGMPPVVRLTVLGLRGVPEHVREAAIAFGASKRFLLFRVDLPLAKDSIMAGVNQTILMCLAMVVVAALIGAKGLGEEVLNALTYANEGQGILAGVAILFCAMILDRIVQGKSGSKEKST